MTSRDFFQPMKWEDRQVADEYSIFLTTSALLIKWWRWWSSFDVATTYLQV